MSTSPIPSDLMKYHPCPRTPLKVSGDLWSRVQGEPLIDSSYRKVQVLTSDPEYHFVMKFFMDQKPPGMSIKNIFYMHNSTQAKNFESNIEVIEKETANPAYAPLGKQEQPKDLRLKVLKRWEKMIEQFSPFEIDQPRTTKYHHTKVLPLWHGTSASKANSIAHSGMTFFGKHPSVATSVHNPLNESTDEGFFGSGIYFTTSARYSRMYSDDGTLILAWVSMREPFPVVSDCPHPQKPSDMKRLAGKGHYQNYNAHYIPVASIDPSNDECMQYYPCYTQQEPAWDEVVVFNKGQTLPRFWIELEADFLKTLVPSANQIPPESEYQLGLKYKEEKNYQKAYDHFLSASAKGHIEALFQLAKVCTKIQDKASQVLPCYESAANKSYVPALVKLGLIYYHGKGVSQDKKKAALYFELASKQVNIEHTPSPTSTASSTSIPSASPPNPISPSSSKPKDPAYLAAALNPTGRGKALIKAIDEGHQEIVMRLLSQDTLLDVKDSSQRTAFLAACQKENTQALELLIQNGGADLQGAEAQQALTFATEHNLFDIVKILIEQGVPLVTHDSSKYATNLCKPLFIVAKQGNLLLLSYFLKKGLNLEELYYKSHTCGDGSHWLTSESLGGKALLIAMQNSHFECAETLLKNGLSLKSQYSSEGSSREGEDKIWSKYLLRRS